MFVCLLRKKCSRAMTYLVVRVEVLMQYVAVLCSQLFRSETSIGANSAEETIGINKADFMSKLYIGSKEARESLILILNCV